MDVIQGDIVALVRKDISSRNKVIEFLYGHPELKDSIHDFVLKNGGDAEKANDVFVKAIMGFIKQCYRPLFELKSDVKAYVFVVARNEWIKMHRQSQKELSTDQFYEGDGELSVEDKWMDEELKDKIRKCVEQLDERCRKVMTMWASSIRMREIALQMGYKSEGMARKKKHECLQKLKSFIKII
ncbi:MAG: sigma-70 family RNA polymerase sigma factor [Saprospiraceae bacterium]|nr:sigma-70 family RNA polymerase sigma factor [Saprospiraceae bacterium]